MAFLDGFTALDTSNVGPAARASRLLADYGMNVIKVAPPPAVGAQREARAPEFYAYGAGRGMRRVQINLKHTDGRAVMSALARNADVFIESFRPGVADRLGIGYADLRRCNPAIVYCSTTGFGQHGSCTAWAGHDLDYLAFSGFLACSGRDGEGRPALPGATVADSAGGGLQAALAIVAALLGRARTGQGAYLDVSVTDGMLSLMSLYLDEYLATGRETRPNSALLTGRFACYGVYATSDGGHLAVAAIEPQFFRNLCDRIGLEGHAHCQYDEACQEQLRAALRERFLTRSRDEWVALLAGHDTCVAPVLSIAEVAAQPHLRARGAFISARRSSGEPFEQLAPVLAGAERAQPCYEIPPEAATDTDAVLQASGLEPDEIGRLRRAGVVA